ncbi:ABC transporter [Halothiobacillus diazotrophicus]|uniref:ABC transporter n=1 Tax=Halothiobacillus diazotrophicus TaxID=1860122 RepID=A0A191ZFN9_9GAMM|nr:ABC transporter ATP-binding protein [Halothiobacillus diazotrophicus]ANJ66696.1 ABC transporter [Halothiobacillus diazotrophicus]
MSDAPDTATPAPILASLPLDLSADLHFLPQELRLTPHALLLHISDQAPETVWPIDDPDLELRLTDHAGIGHLQLVDRTRTRAQWHFTLSRMPAAQALVTRFDALRHPRIDHPDTNIDEKPLAAEWPEEGSDALTPPSTWTLFRLWRFARPYRAQLLLGFILTLAATAATLVPPYLTMPLMDDVLIPYQNGVPIQATTVMKYLGGLLGAALVAWSLGWARTYILARVSERIGADIRTTTYNHLLSLSLDYFGSKRTGDLMARIGSETDRINIFLSLHLLDFATDVLMITMTVIILFSINPWLALVTLLPLPLIAWMIHLVRDRLRTGFERVDRMWSQVTNILSDTIPGIRVVKAFSQEGREADRFHQANQQNLRINDRVNRVWSLFAPSVTALTELGLLIVWAFGIWQVSQGAITVGVLTAFLAYIGRFYARMDSMSRIVSVTQKTAAGAKRIFDILDHSASVPDPQHPQPLDGRPTAIRLRQVGFRHGNRGILHDIDLDIEPGSMIGLVGHSGSGKTTLVNLIARFYDVSSGSIQLDGTDIRQFSVADYRRQIGLVLQEPFLFFGTVAENIAYGNPNADRAAIIQAARAAHAHEFILKLPQGYDSLVGERGQALSGGERQRISIARALLIDPRMLILDEATASVDTETEREIQQALDNLVQGRTTIAIAHRLSTLRQADKLVVLDQGRIVETGRHDELLARQGHYYRLYQAQLKLNETSGLPDTSTEGTSHVAA